jgi:hypothetical protein
MPEPSSNTPFGALKAPHGTMQIGILRSHYGPQFARGCSDSERLSEALHKLDEPTLTKLLDAHETAVSSRKSAEASVKAAAACHRAEI